MSAFAKHGISHLSASHINLWIEHPGLWAIRYLGNVKDEGGASMTRGKAVEDGLTALLHGKPLETAISAAMQTYENNIQGELSDEIDAERKLIEPMVKMLSSCWPASYGVNQLTGTQFKIESWLDGVSVPFIGYIDFLFEDRIIDLKTTKRMPDGGRPKPDHIRQVALYTEAKGKPASLAYVSDKRFLLCDVGEQDSKAALDDLRGHALTLERFLSRVDSAADALHILPFNTDFWKVNEQAIEARRVLMGAMQ